MNAWLYISSHFSSLGTLFVIFFYFTLCTDYHIFFADKLREVSSRVHSTKLVYEAGDG